VAPVRLCVFGGLRLWRSDIEVAIGSGRVRTVLAVLLAARGATVSVAELVDTVWGDRPSASAVNQVQRLVGQVRRLFEPELPSRETGEWLPPVGEGYRLRQDARTSDLMAFFALAAEARAGDARQKLEQALILAQNRPFAGLPAGVLGLPAFTAIEVARTEAAVQAADLALSDSRVHSLLQPAAFHIARWIYAFGAARPSEVAEAVGMDRSSSSTLIGKMRSLGLLVAAPAPDDRRGIIVQLSAEGRERVAATLDERGREFYARTRAWPDDDLAHLVELLARLTANPV
jgi:DNA-binding MarR family transcriptional regulator/DNA-binding winged helix-turn-helix (wHTH) protein